MCDTRLHSHVAFVRNWLTVVARPIADLRAKELHLQSGSSRLEALLPREMPGDDMELSMDDMEMLMSSVREKVLSLHKSAPPECEISLYPDADEPLESGVRAVSEVIVQDEKAKGGDSSEDDETSSFEIPAQVKCDRLMSFQSQLQSKIDEIHEALQLPDDELLCLPTLEHLIADTAANGHEALRHRPLCEKQLQPQKSSSELGCKLMEAAWCCQRAGVQSDVHWQPEPQKVSNSLSISQISGHCRPRVGKFQRLARNMVAVQQEAEQDIARQIERMRTFERQAAERRRLRTSADALHK